MTDSSGNSHYIHNVHLFDPAGNVDSIGSLIIRNGVIESIGADPAYEEGMDRIDGNGCYLFPAFCDPHVHFRTPGQTQKEDLESGSRAALAGGYTTVIQMPNTYPVVDNPALVKELTRTEPLELKVMGAVTQGNNSRELTDFGALQDAGAVAFTDDGKPVEELIFMRAALKYSGEHNIPVASHAEDLSIGLQGALRPGAIAESLGVPSWNPKRETAMVERDVKLAKMTGGHVHLMHISALDSLDWIKRAKNKNIKVTAEVTPHHLALTVNDVGMIGSNAKMNPPLGTEEDREALIAALADGTIDCIATDHAPHTPEEKARSIDRAPYGVIGLETSFGVLHTKLVMEGRITLARLVDAMGRIPREIFHLERVGLFKGSRADIILVDTQKVWTVDPEKFESKGRNCPFAGWSLTGKVIWTMYRGVKNTNK